MNKDFKYYVTNSKKLADAISLITGERYYVFGDKIGQCRGFSFLNIEAVRQASDGIWELKNKLHK